jgi:hypothetical protein
MRIFWHLIASITLCTISMICAANSPSFAVGDPLSDALRHYASSELNIIFSSRVVPPRYKVQQLPDPSDAALKQIRMLLTPHGLELVMTNTADGYIRKAATETNNATAPSNPKPETTRPIEEMVVSAPYRIEGRRFQSTSLPQEDLQTLPSLGRDALRGLSVLPGSAPSGVSARQRFRGGDNNEVLYRLDGVTLAEPFHLNSAQSLFSAFNPNIIDSANVYLSGFPVSLGTRMSGVVDLNLVESEEAFSGNLDINSIAAAINAAGSSGSVNWLVSARHSLIDQVLRAVETDYGTPKFDDELARLRWTGTNSTLTFGALRSTESLELQYPDEGEEGEATERTETLWLTWEYAHTDSLESRWRLVWNKTRTDRSGELEGIDFSEGELTDKKFYRAYGLANDWRWFRPNGMEISSGWSLEQQRGRFQSSLQAQYGPLAVPIQNRLTLDQQILVVSSGTSSSAYVSLHHPINEQLAITTGIRYDGQDLDPVHVSELSARLRLNYVINDRLQSFIDLGRYTQQQQLLEIQTDDGKAELDDPQHSDQINLGLLWDLTEELSIRIEGYHRIIDNPWSRYDNLYNRWVLLPELQGDRYLLAANKARARGLEVSARGGWGDSFDWYWNYSLSDVEEQVNKRWLKRPWHQQHSAKAGFRWQTQAWQLGISATYRSGWPTTDFVVDPSLLPNNINNGELPNHFSLDLHLGRVFRSPIGELELYVDISNATNRRNVGGYRYNASGVASAERLLPIVPALGVSLHW